MGIEPNTRTELLSWTSTGEPGGGRIIVQPCVLTASIALFMLSTGFLASLLAALSPFSQYGETTPNDVPEIAMTIQDGKTWILLDSATNEPNALAESKHVHFDNALGTAILPIVATEHTSESPMGIIRLTTEATAEFGRIHPELHIIGFSPKLSGDANVTHLKYIQVTFRQKPQL